MTYQPKEIVPCWVQALLMLSVETEFHWDNSLSHFTIENHPNHLEIWTFIPQNFKTIQLPNDEKPPFKALLLFIMVLDFIIHEYPNPLGFFVYRLFCHSQITLENTIFLKSTVDITLTDFHSIFILDQITIGKSDYIKNKIWIVFHF